MGKKGIREVDGEGTLRFFSDGFVGLSLDAACMNLGVDLYKAAVFQMMQSTCANARCRHVQAAVSSPPISVSSLIFRPYISLYHSVTHVSNGICNRE